MTHIPAELAQHLAIYGALTYELAQSPYLCELWPSTDLEHFNQEYKVPIYAPGFTGFGTSGGGEMFAIAPDSAIVCLPFVGMEPLAAMPIASSMRGFLAMLQPAN
jgi:hypothetical protein